MSAAQTPIQSIYKWSLETPEAIAINGWNGKLTYANFAINIAKFIKAFEAVGVKKGMLIGVHLESPQPAIELILAYSLEAIGAVSVTQLSENEIVKRCDFIFTIPPFPRTENNPIVINLTQEWINAANKISLSSADLERLNYKPAAADAVFFNSTSGTTGQKKYFLETHASMQYQFLLMKAIYFQAEISNFLCLYGVSLGLAYVGCSLALIKGGTVIFTSQDLFLEDMNSHTNSHSAIILRDAIYFQRSFTEGIQGNKLTTLRVLGAHLPIYTRAWLEKNLAKIVFNSYSSNESGQICDVQADNQGEIYPGVNVKIVNKNWEDLSFGETGRIAIKSPMQISNYLWNAELNLNHFKDGWFYSNDIGYMPQTGKLIVVDRADNMLNLGGIKVPPKPIEDSIRLITGVNDCALLSENSFFEFETLLICIEIAGKFDKKTLDCSTKKVLENRFKSYRIFYFENFPRTETGKIQRNELKKIVLESFSLSKLEPQQPQISTQIQQGLALHLQGNLKEAQTIYEQVIRISPNNFDALRLLGVIFLQTKQYPQTVEFLSKALQIKPDDADANSNLGLALKVLGRLDEALASYDKAIAIKPDHADAYYNRGIALRELKLLDEAIASYDKAISIKPDYADAYSNRGVALQELKHFEEAIASYDKAISIKPDYADAYSNRGNALKELKRLDEALTSYDKAIAIKPDHADAYNNRGLALRELKYFEEAIASYDKAISIKPDYVEAYTSRGVALQELGRLDEALTSYDKAIAIKPDYTDAHWNLSLCNLLGGNFKDGWQGYEWGWKANPRGTKRHFTEPVWLGAESLKDKAILLRAEQGFGDTIQFCRYVSLVAKLGAKVILEVQRPLLKLLSNLEGVSKIVANGDELSEFDYQCPLMSLPLAFKTELHTIPSVSQHIFSDIEKIAKWQAILGNKTKPRVGIVWSGSSIHKNDHNRSLTLSQLISHFPSHCQYISLQKEVSEIDKDFLAKHPEINHFGDTLHDFSETAALCELMDVVISVDTSVAHLAGTLRKTTWILLPYSPDWRWLLDRSDSPWYLSVTLYRQEKINDWDDVLERVKADLNKLVKKHLG